MRRAASWSLATRIVALSFVLLLLVQVTSFAVVRTSIERNARESLERTLAGDERVWLRLLEQNAEILRQGATLLAADYGFRSAVNSGDAETIRSALENQGSRIGASVTALLGPDFALQQSSGSDDAATLGAVVMARAAAMPSASSGARLVFVGLPYQFVMVPIRAPLVIGWVLMGFPVGQQLGDDFHALAGGDIAVVAGADGSEGRVVVSTLPRNYAMALTDGKGSGYELHTDDGRLLARRVSMPTEGGETSALLLRSIDQAVAPYRSLQLLLAGITLLGVLLFAIGMVLAARRVTTPLRSLIASAKRLGGGRYDQPIAYTRRRDEIGALARSFDQMRVSISEQQAEVRRLAFQDRLTALPNRARFQEQVQQAILRNREAATPLSVLTLDLDRFKHVNDVLGYPFGDRLLVAVAARLRSAVRPDDVVARLGGNAFGVLLVQDDVRSALDVAGRIIASFETPIALEDQTVDLSAGIGIACWPAHADDADLLMSRSEMAMYAAKRSTAGILAYDPALDSASALNLTLLSELRHAIVHGELRLFVQPKIRLADGAVIGAEALVRWQHPQRGMVPPMQFIPFAEQTGFVRQLTGWVLAEAARLWSSVQAVDAPVKLSVNLSTRDLLDPELPARLPLLLAAHGVPPSAFCLEITESAIMDDPRRAEATLNRLAEQGFSLSIDDFGTGYSSLAYLRRLPVDELKIDKSFVMGMQADESDGTIVRSTIDLAHNLGLRVVAEGVETAAIYARLSALGCDEAQGYHMARPLPVEQFADWRAQWLEAQRAAVAS